MEACLLQIRAAIQNNDIFYEFNKQSIKHTTSIPPLRITFTRHTGLIRRSTSLVTAVLSIKAVANRTAHAVLQAVSADSHNSSRSMLERNASKDGFTGLMPAESYSNNENTNFKTFSRSQQTLINTRP
jgi:hypothetical protein